MEEDLLSAEMVPELLAVDLSGALALDRGCIFHFVFICEHVLVDRVSIWEHKWSGVAHEGALLVPLVKHTAVQHSLHLL